MYHPVTCIVYQCVFIFFLNFSPVLHNASGLCTQYLWFSYYYFSPELCDVVIVSEDGSELKCHKCILVARLGMHIQSFRFN